MARTGGSQGQRRAHALAARPDQVAGDLGQEGVARLHGGDELVLDPPEVGLENRELQERARCGHTVTIGAPWRNAPTAATRRGPGADSSNTGAEASRAGRDWPM